MKSLTPELEKMRKEVKSLNYFISEVLSKDYKQAKQEEEIIKEVEEELGIKF